MILFFGPAGAGKSVQGQFLGIRRGWQWVSSGNMLRATQDPEIQADLQKGLLISSEKMYRLFDEVFQKSGSEQIILDGFPRKVEQAEWLYENESKYGYTIDLAVVIDVSEDEVVKRMSARGRADDSPEAVAERLRIYHQENEPILTFLEQKNIPIARVNGVGKIGLIHETINEEVNLVLK